MKNETNFNNSVLRMVHVQSSFNLAFPGSGRVQAQIFGPFTICHGHKLQAFLPSQMTCIVQRASLACHLNYFHFYTG